MQIDELGKVSDGVRYAALLPDLKREIARMEKAVENRIFLAIRDGSLTPEAALNAWMEKKSLRDLVSRFEGRVRVGQSIGERLAPQLNSAYLQDEPNLP